MVGHPSHATRDLPTANVLRRSIAHYPRNVGANSFAQAALSSPRPNKFGPTHVRPCPAPFFATCNESLSEIVATRKLRTLSLSALSVPARSVALMCQGCCLDRVFICAIASNGNRPIPDRTVVGPPDHRQSGRCDAAKKRIAPLVETRAADCGSSTRVAQRSLVCDASHCSPRCRSKPECLEGEPNA